MKKLKTLLCALLAAGGVTVAAQDANPVADDARTASFTVKTDNPAAFTLYRSSDYSTVSCEENETTVNFNPDTETGYMIETNYGFSIFKVTLNEENVEDSSSRYFVTVKNGDVLNIVTEFPDEEATVTFSYNEGGKGCITDVRVNNELVSDFNGETLKVKLGDNLSFGKTDNWNITAYTLNGKTESYFSYFNSVVKGDMDFSFVAQYDDPIITLNIEVDNPSAVKYSYYSSASSSMVSEVLNAGNNEIKVERYTSLTFEPIEPYAFKEIINLDNNTPESVYGSWYLTANSYSGKNYRITTYNEADSRTATATFNVDDASKVSVRRNKDYYTFELQNGKNEIKFNPETEELFSVMPTSEVPLWEVKVNGVPQTSNGGYYELTLTDKCTVDITATIPDKDIKATFEITDEDAAANLITGIKVNDQEVDFNGTSVDLKAGQKIALTFNDQYKIDNFTVGDRTESVSYSSYTSPVLMEDAKFVIAAHKLSTIKVKVIVDDPENIVISNSYDMYYNTNILDLRAGENEVELPENNTSICWQIKNGCELLNVKYNDSDINTNYTYSQTMEENSVIEFTTAKINYDKKAVVWIDDRTAANQYFSLEGNSGDRKSIDATTGYTEFSFRDAMLPLNLSWYGENATVGKVYINNNLIDAQYPGSSSYSLPINDGDVIKIFLANEPAESKLKFDVEEGLEVTATTDRIVPVNDFTAEHTVFNGTEVILTLADNNDIIVKNGETELTPGEDGKYVVTVNGDTNLSVKRVAKGNLTISLSATELTLGVGETAELGAEIKCDADVTVEKKERTSSDEAVATIDNKGTVTAVSVGKTTITVTVTDNYGREFSASCEVTVTEKSGILTVESGALTSDVEVYDLRGRRVNKPVRGLYIINGKKVIVK